MSLVTVDNHKSETGVNVRAKLVEYNVSEQLLDRLAPNELDDLLERIETLVSKYEKVLQDEADSLAPAD